MILRLKYLGVIFVVFCLGVWYILTDDPDNPTIT